MAINLNFLKISPMLNITAENRKHQCFKAKLKQDKFEKNNKAKILKLNVFNPYANIAFSVKTPVDLSKKQKIILASNHQRFLDKKLVVDYDPENYGYIFDKKSNSPEKVMILTGHDDKKLDEISYHFMSCDLRKEYGYVHLSLHLNPETDVRNCYFLDEDILKDYPIYNVTGPRVIVEYLQNSYATEKGGIGKLADKLAVKYCLDNHIKPVITSVADKGSHVAHYLRGKRFLPPPKDTSSYAYLKERYGCTDLNKILEKLVKESDVTGDKIDLGNLGIFPMYMPSELVSKYRQEIEAQKKSTHL